MTKESKKLSSYYALFVIGTLIIVNIILIAINFRKIIESNEKPYFAILTITCIGALIGVVGTFHLGFKKVHYYNPFDFLHKNVFSKKQRNYPGLW